ncbi:MAG: NHL repeat-containing protein [Candidatus Krumholzibacteriota bacterium]|nr:NHL repeat-containing protein [Candidatus Krumholzibacteriota bacterium]
MKVKELVLLLLLSLAMLHLAVGGKTGATLTFPPWSHNLGIQKITQFHLDIYSGYRAKFNDPQGIFCTKLACNDDPSTRKDDDELTVFGLNSGNHTLIYNKGLTAMGFAGNNSGPGMEFKHPRDVAGDREGNLFIADTGNDRLVHLRYAGGDLVFVKEIKYFAQDSLLSPRGVHVSGNRIFVADSGNDRVVVFDYDGVLLEILAPRWKGMKLRGPISITAAGETDDWFYYDMYYIAVVDSLGKRLWKISTEKDQVTLFDASASDNIGRFNHLDIDYYANLYVTDTERNLIHKFDRHLNYIIAIGDDKQKAIDLDQPRGISISRRFGQVFVAERSGAQYFWIGTDIVDLALDSLEVDVEEESCRLEIRGLFTEHSLVDMYLEDSRGVKRLSIVENYLLPGGKFRKLVILPCPAAKAFAKCKFRLVAVAKPTYSSEEYFRMERKTTFIEPGLKTAYSSSI